MKGLRVKRTLSLSLREGVRIKHKVVTPKGRMVATVNTQEEANALIRKLKRP